MALERCFWWAQKIQTASKLRPMMMSFSQIPDQWRNAWIPLRAASNATSHTSTWKPWTKNYRISWKPYHHAPKKFKFKSSGQEFFKRHRVTSLHVTISSIQITVISKGTKNPSSKSIWHWKRNSGNTSTRSPRNSFQKLLENWSRFQITFGCIILRWWTKDSLHLN